jgi:hypothetical protein
LRGIQQMMSQVLFRPLTRNEGMQPEWTDGRPTADVVETFIKPNDRLSSFERLEIYNQQYWWRLLGIFQEDFRGLRSVVGVRKFDKLAVEYLQAHGSTTWSLRDLGQYLVRFLEAHPELTAPNTPLAHDMARVEWAKVIAFDGPALPVLDPQKIARTAPDQLKLRLQPYLTLLELRYPIDQMLKRLREKAISSARASNAMSGARQGLSAPSVRSQSHTDLPRRASTGVLRLLQAARSRSVSAPCGATGRRQPRRRLRDSVRDIEHSRNPGRRKDPHLVSSVDGARLAGSVVAEHLFLERSFPVRIRPRQEYFSIANASLPEFQSAPYANDACSAGRTSGRTARDRRT